MGIQEAWIAYKKLIQMEEDANENGLDLTLAKEAFIEGWISCEKYLAAKAEKQRADK